MGDSANDNKPLEKVLGRDIPHKTTYYLFARSAGRCEICNDLIIEHHLTGQLGNFGQRGHIYAFKLGGSRGKEGGRPDDIHDISNLMLVCHKCHREVDEERPADYPVEHLIRLKVAHEQRVFELTGITDDKKRVPLVLRGMVAGRSLSISDAEIRDAMLPDYPAVHDRIDINLTPLPDNPVPSFWSTCSAAIDDHVDRLSSIQRRYSDALRLAVFAIAPIPLLIYLGSKLSDKADVELYQRHRNPEQWKWHEGGSAVHYVVDRVKDGDGRIALLLNLSGTNPVESVIATLGDDACVYELTLRNAQPSPLFLNTRSDLQRFRVAYERLLIQIIAEHSCNERLHLFPAVPAPVAVLCGRARLPKVAPAMAIYDRDKRSGGFIHTLEIQ